MGQFLMPSLGADMEAGTLVEWTKSPGDAVTRGDIIAVVETQKGAIEVEVFETGTLESQLVEIGKKVPVGTPLAMIKTDGAVAPPPEAIVKVPPSPAKPTTPAKPPMPPAPQVQSGERLRITPAALRLAQELGVDPRAARTSGTGPEGAFTRDDILALTKTTTSQTPQTTPTDGMRAAIAAAMSKSKAEIPHYYLMQEIDLTAADAFVTETNAQRPPEDRLLLGALYLKAVAKAVSKFTEFNGYFTDGNFQPSKQVNTGMAITIRGGGLVAPAIHDADTLELTVLMTRLRELAERVRAGRFRATELSGATITVTSLGDRGVGQLYGIIYPPQVAIVGIGTPAMRAAVIDGAVKPRLTALFTLAADHRVSDGHRGALFLRAIDANLQAPEKL